MFLSSPGNWWLGELMWLERYATLDRNVVASVASRSLETYAMEVYQMTSL